MVRYIYVHLCILLQQQHTACRRYVGVTCRRVSQIDITAVWVRIWGKNYIPSILAAVLLQDIIDSEIATAFLRWILYLARPQRIRSTLADRISTGIGPYL
jgi:hypothetical protein